MERGRISLGLAATVGGFLLAFALLAALKRGSPETDTVEPARGATAEERQLAQQFWEVYRRATTDRIAGRVRDAAADYARALELRPLHEDALYYAGNMALELGKFSEAEGFWKRFVEINPHGARTYSQLGMLYKCPESGDLFDLELARQAFYRVAEINQEESGPLLHLGEIALMENELSKAVEYFDQVIAWNYKSVPAHFLKGYVFWKKNDTGEATRQFEKSVEFAIPEAPVKGVAGEGDTKAGTPMLARPSVCRGFERFADSLPAPGSADVLREMQRRYRELDAALREIRRRLGT
jgi:tetratricopeptide (TPR) repeat protein